MLRSTPAGLAAVGRDLVDLVLPRTCVYCRQPGQTWCPACRPAPVPEPVAVAVADLTVWAARDYADALRSALLGYKERGRSDLAAPLSAYLVAAVRSARSDALPDFPQAGAGPGAPAPAPPVLVPVPSRRSAARARGGDHVLRLARRAAREVGAELARPLWLLGGVRDSAGLGETERARNVSHRMRAVAAPPGAGPVLLVDDIVTTGSTLIEASRALRAGGWTVLDAAVVAATRRRRPGTGRPW